MKSILTPIRTEEGRRIRREMGDHENFQHRVWTPRPDGTSNTITSVQKDNLMIEVYEVDSSGTDAE